MRSIVHVLLGAAVALAASRGVASKEILKTRTTWDGAPIVSPVATEPQVQALIVEVAPGAATAWHKHPVNNYAYVLEGSLRVELETGTAHDFKAGDAFAEVVNTWHRGVNAGAAPAKLVVFYIGENGAPVSIGKPMETAPSRAAP